MIDLKAALYEREVQARQVKLGGEDVARNQRARAAPSPGDRQRPSPATSASERHAGDPTMSQDPVPQARARGGVWHGGAVLVCGAACSWHAEAASTPLPTRLLLVRHGATLK